MILRRIPPKNEIVQKQKTHIRIDHRAFRYNVSRCEVKSGLQQYKLKVFHMSEVKLTAVDEFHWLGTGESDQAKQHEKTSPDVHGSFPEKPRKTN